MKFILGLILLLQWGYSFAQQTQFKTVDAALAHKGKIYLFEKNNYRRFTPAANGFKLDSGYPKAMPGGWQGLPVNFKQEIDAAFYHPKENRAYFFHKNYVVRLKGYTVEPGFPKPLTYWKGLPYEFQSGIDAAVFRAGKIYLFRGNSYIRISGRSMDTGYPKRLPGGWQLPTDYSAGINAALHYSSHNYFFSQTSFTRLKDTKRERGYPISLNKFEAKAEPMKVVLLKPEPMPDLTMVDRVYVNGKKFENNQMLELRQSDVKRRNNGRCSVPLDFFVRNTGAADIKQPFHVKLQSYQDASITHNINSLGAGNNKTIHSTVWIEPNSVLNIFIVADIKNGVDEVSESNNSLMLRALLVANCDDPPTDIKVAKAGSIINNDIRLVESKPELSVSLESPMSKHIKIENTGVVESPSGVTLLVACAFTPPGEPSRVCGNGLVLETLVVPSIEAYQSKQLTLSKFNFSNAKTGNYKFTVTVDTKNIVDEVDETNNTSVSNYTVTPPPPPPISGKTVFQEHGCADCHTERIPFPDAPKLGEKAIWQNRLVERGGIDGLENSVRKGYKNMAAFPELSSKEVTEVVRYLCDCD